MKKLLEHQNFMICENHIDSNTTEEMIQYSILGNGSSTVAHVTRRNWGRHKKKIKSKLKTSPGVTQTALHPCGYAKNAAQIISEALSLSAATGKFPLEIYNDKKKLEAILAIMLAEFHDKKNVNTENLTKGQKAIIKTAKNHLGWEEPK